MTITIDNKGWIKEAEGIYYGADSFGPFEPGITKWIVIHGTAWPNGTAEDIAKIWASQVAAGQLGAATHSIIDKTGYLTQGITLLNTGAGNSGAPDSTREPYLPAGNLNMCTISVEHCKYNTDDSDILTPEQVATSFDFCLAVCDFLNIPKQVWSVGDVTHGGIIPHSACDWKYREHCPGPYPWADLQTFLNNSNKTTVPPKKGETPMFNNTACVQVWNSTGMGSDDAARSSGIFSYWRDQWENHSNYLGAPTTHEYVFHQNDEPIITVARNFGSNTVVWNNGNPYILS
jgi:hypothetical protein